jgi:hypothetical protein
LPDALLVQHICTLEQPGVQRAAVVRLSHAPSANNATAENAAR